MDKLKEYVAVHVCNKATMATRAMAMEEMKAPIFTKTERPVCMYWSGTRREAGASNKTKQKRNAETDNNPKLEDWEHKLAVDKCLEYTTHKEGTQVWTESKGKCYYLVLQHCLPELKTALKKLVRWEAVALDTYVISLLLIVRDVIHKKKGEGSEHDGSCGEQYGSLHTNDGWDGHVGQILQRI